MSYTITAGTGSNVAAGTNPTPAYPSTGMGSGKLALLHLGIKNDSSGSLTPPAGWTQRGSTATQGTDSQSIWSRELDGTETPGGTITVTSTGSSGRRAADIYIVDTAGGAGWNFEDIDAETGAASTTINDNNVTTGGNARLALNAIFYSNRQTGGQENFAGETGGSWVASAFYDGGANPTLSLQTAELVSAGTIGSGSDTSIVSSAWIIHGLSTWRNASSQPDLVIDALTWDVGQAAVGEPLVFSANIHNTGVGASPSGVAHRVRFEISGNAVAFSTSYMTSLVKVSGSAVVAADGTWVPSAAVSTAVVGIVDDLGLIAESNEGNNTFTRDITPIHRPNLRISDILWTPVSALVGSNVAFSAVIENAGLGASPVTAHVIKFEVGGSEVANATGQTASIAVSALVTATADGFWVPAGAGTYSIVATVDPNNIIKEFNETDNSRTENIVVDVGTGNVTSFNGRGGAVVPIISDYDAFFLTPSEGDDLFLTPAEGDARYLQQVSADVRYIQAVSANAMFIDQSEADAQGMPAIEAGGTGATTVPVREVNANFTLLSPSVPANYWQSYYNISVGPITVSPPAGHTITGNTQIAADSSALFIKKAGATVFRRWS